MGQTVFTGPVVSGDLQVGQTNGPNQGYCQLLQSVTIGYDATLTQAATLYVPAGSYITAFDVDVLTAYNSATSATLKIGNAAAGSQYVSSVDCKTATGRIAITYTAAQLAAMSGQSVLGVASATLAPVVITIVSVGQPTAGFVNVTVKYAQLTSS